jgi:branched-chain amino acid transport system permease protein
MLFASGNEFEKHIFQKIWLSIGFKYSMQIGLNGLISGLGIALLAVGFQIIYLPTRVFCVGLAGLYTIAAYGYLASQAAFGQWYLSLIASLGGVVVLSLLIEWANHAPLTRKGASDGAHLISSLGIYIILVQTVAMIWGNDTQSLRQGVESTVHSGGVVLTQSQLLMAGVGSILLLGYLVMLRASLLGLRLRAMPLT